jgi:pimeloyl-ACP methyl ester carboxylesterase
MKNNPLPLSPLSTVPSLDFGGNGKNLVFLHANGYPPECYRPLLARLAEKYRVTAMLQRPLWPGSRPENIEDWRPLTDDFLRFLDEQQTARFNVAQHKPLVCVGHSMGGIALLRAALREPERFKAIVLLDPVLFRPYFITIWNIMRAMKLGQRFHPLVAGARQRRRQFDDLERLYNGYRRKSVFKYLDDEALRAYIEGIACQRDEGGYQLCYSADWEIRIYLTGIWRDRDIWRGLPELKVPALIVRGAETDTFRERTGKLVKRKQPRVQVETLEKSTHLLPLERPNEVSNLIQAFFEEYA